MGFWVFMFVNCLLIPAVMIGFGTLFQKHPPKQINSLYGYRTKMSMLNMDTWNYAHMYFGRLWLRVGYLLLPLTVFGMFLGFQKDEGVVGIVGIIIVIVQIAAVLLPVVWTERELRRVFESDGCRKGKQAV